jgi:hypothetical protein
MTAAHSIVVVLLKIAFIILTSLFIFLYDYPFSTPTKNAVNKRIIERCIAAVFVVCQRDNHIFFTTKAHRAGAHCEEFAPNDGASLLML